MKKLKKDILSFTKAGVLTGVGASVVTKVGGNASGLARLSSYYPIMGKTLGAKHVLRALKKVKK